MHLARGMEPEEEAACGCLSAPRSLQLEQLITHEMFSSIMADFHSHNQNSSTYQTTQERTKMTTEDFQVAISKQLGRSPHDESIKQLCNKVILCTCVFC